MTMMSRQAPQVSGLLDPLSRAKALEPIIRKEALRGQELHQMSDEMTQAFTESGLFKMNVPLELGGEEFDMQTRIDVIEELARADGSIGWTFMAIAGYLGYVSVGVGDEAVKDIFSNPDVRIAGMANPVGTIIDTPDGYSIHGKYKFGSGVPQSNWIAVGGLVHGGEEDGSMLCCVVPTETADVKGGWDPIGLVGTGSVDYDISERVVPKSYSFNVGNYVPQRGGPSGRMDFFSTAMVYHAAIAFGVAKRALEEIIEIADTGKRRPGADLILDQQLFQHDFAVHEGKLRAARAYVRELADDGIATGTRGDTLTDVQAGRFRQAAALVHRVALDAVEFAFFWGGSASLRKPTALGRCMVDIHALNNHILVDHSNFASVTAALATEYRRPPAE